MNAGETPLEDENLDPKKFFDKKEYNTLLVNREGFNSSQNQMADLLEQLLDKKTERQEKETIFSALKKADARAILIAAINEVNRNEEKAALIAACWESGLDFTNDFLFFSELACHKDFSVAMEALTVLETIENQVSQEVLTKALLYTQNHKSQNESLIKDLIDNIQRRIT